MIEGKVVGEGSVVEIGSVVRRGAIIGKVYYFPLYIFPTLKSFQGIEERS